MSVVNAVRCASRALVMSLAFAGTLALYADDSSVMLWFIDGNTQKVDVGGGEKICITDLMGWSADEDLNELAARVRVVDDDGMSLFLDLWYYDDVQKTYVKDLGLKETWINESGQSGVNYSPLPSTLDVDSAQFIVELGRLTWDEDADDLVWQVTLATSRTASYEELYNSGHISPGELAIPDHTPWSNFNFVAPEPSSGLLLLLGGAICLLRRKNRILGRRTGFDDAAEFTA